MTDTVQFYDPRMGIGDPVSKYPHYRTCAHFIATAITRATYYAA